MGFRFNLQAANWLAHILAPSGLAAPPPPEGIQYGFREFLQRLDRDFYAGPHHRHDLLRRLDEVRARIESGSSPARVAEPLREYFRDVRWCALLIPGLGERAARWMSDVHTLRHLVRIHPDDPGLILQVEESFGPEVALINTFPALSVAVRAAHRWPGVLLWTPTGDAAFFSSPPASEGIDRLGWIFSHLAVMPGSPDLALLERQYIKEFPDAGDEGVMRLLHLSDLHLGSPEANRRIPRVQGLLSTLTESLTTRGQPVQAVVTGDLMDTPSEENLDRVRAFLHFLKSVTGNDPFVVLGNHDVRNNGWLDQNLSQVMALETDRRREVLDGRVLLLGFNSAMGGRLAQGEIGERQMLDAGNAVDAIERDGKRRVKIAILHHHPHPVKRPDWHRREWYERLLGDWFEETDALRDADAFMGWSRARSIAACLHGHKHIPRVDEVEGLAVIGCGSTVGKVGTATVGETYMSVNVLTLDPAHGNIVCRLAAERIPGAGLTDQVSHEIVYRHTRDMQ